MAITERIQIEVSENGSRVVKRNIEEVGGAARKAADGIGFLQAALGALTFKAAASIIDSYTLMQKKIISVTNSQAELAAVTQRLYEVAGATRQGIGTVTDAYFRFNGALEKLGYSQNEVLGLTETISKAFIIAGSTAEETERAMIQLAQGFSKNKLQTQDLKAAMEQAPYVISVLARNLNIAGFSAEQAEFALYELAESGKLTSKVMYDAFVQARKEIEEKFLKTLPTIEQGVIAIQRSFSRWVGEMATSSGLANALGVGLQNIAENFNNIASYVGVALAAFAGMAAVKLLLMAVAGAAALVASPFILLAGVVAGSVAAIYAFGDSVKLAGSETLTLKGLAVQAFTEAKEKASQWYTDLQKKVPEVGKVLRKVFGTDMNISLKSMLTYAYDGAQKIGVFFVAAGETFIESWRLIPAALYDIIARAINGVTSLVAKGLNAVYNGITTFVGDIIGKQFEELKLGGLDIQVTGAADRIAGTFVTKVQEGVAKLTPAGDVIDGLYKRAEEAEKRYAAQQKETIEKVAAAKAALDQKRPDRTPDIRGEVQRFINDLQKEAEALKLVNDQYTIRHALNQIEKQNNIELTALEKQKVEAALQTNLNLQRQKELMESIIAPQETFKQQQAALNALYNEGKIGVEQYNQQLDQMTLKYLQALPAATTFTEGLSRQMQIMTLETKNAMGIMGTEVAKIFGPGGSLVNGVADAVAQSIVFGKSWKDQIRQVAQSILSQLISALVKMGLNMIMQAALGQGLMATSGVTAVATGATITAAMAPAAAMTTMATGGANIGGAASGIGTIMGLMASLAGSLGGMFGGFKDGGYTGPVGTNQVAGIVHGQEFVMNAQATRKHRATLEALNAGRELGTQVVAPQAPPVSVNITNEIPDAAFEARALSENEVEIIARRVVRREAPEVFASDVRNPNSRTGKAISSNTTAARRR